MSKWEWKKVKRIPRNAKLLGVYSTSLYSSLDRVVEYLYKSADGYYIDGEGGARTCYGHSDGDLVAPGGGYYYLTATQGREYIEAHRAGRDGGEWIEY